ncbi:MAG TPA: hypothetical protein VNQ76_15050, partial [Planctomicrobium sp.]|nr:hypothetical protein [Planctomicrobium sp.]
MSGKRFSNLIQRSATVTAAVLLAVVIFGTCRSSWGQDTKSVILPAPPTANLDRIDEIYIPAALLDVVMKQDGWSALLSRDEFEKLVTAARAAVPAGTQQTETPLIGAARYEGEFVGSRLQANVQLSVTTFSPASEVVFAVGDWNVESATLGEQPAALTRDGKDPGQLRLFVSKPETHTLTLKLSMPLQTVGSDQLAPVALLGESSGEFHVTLPAGKSLLANGLLLSRPSPIEEPASYIVPTGGQTKILLTVTDRTQSTRSDSLTFASTVYGLKLLPGEVSWSTSTQLQVFGHQIDQLICLIPRQLEIKAVQSDGL